VAHDGAIIGITVISAAMSRPADDGVFLEEIGNEIGRHNPRLLAC
jgi:hypothetical protein